MKSKSHTIKENNNNRWNTRFNLTQKIQTFKEKLFSSQTHFLEGCTRFYWYFKNIDFRLWNANNYTNRHFSRNPILFHPIFLTWSLLKSLISLRRAGVDIVENLKRLLHWNDSWSFKIKVRRRAVSNKTKDTFFLRESEIWNQNDCAKNVVVAAAHSVVL